MVSLKLADRPLLVLRQLNELNWNDLSRHQVSLWWMVMGVDGVWKHVLFITKIRGTMMVYDIRYM